MNVSLDSEPRAKRKSFRQAAAESMRDRLGADAQVSLGKMTIFVYAATAEGAASAEHVARDVLAVHNAIASLRVERWDEIAKEWRDITAGSPDNDDDAQLTHEYLMDAEREQAAETGRAVWLVRVELPVHGDLKALATRLEAEGWQVVSRRRFLLAGADCEDDARTLAQLIRGHSTPSAVIRIQRAVYSLPWWLTAQGMQGT